MSYNLINFQIPLFACCCVVAQAGMVGGNASKKIKLGAPFINNAIFQQKQKIAVWGVAGKGDLIYAKLNGRKVNTTAEADGYFCLYLPEMNAGGPYILTLTNKTTGETRKLENILIGEVWLCSGQSNMEFKLSQADEKQIKDYNRESRNSASLIRFFQVPDLLWVDNTPENALKCSAVAAWFATKLHHELKVPIGMVISAWGGSCIESWIGTTEKANAGSMVLLPKYIEEPDTVTIKAFAQISTSDWKEMPVPGNWVGSSKNYGKHGAVWFRRDLTLPDNWHGKDLVLHLSGVDKEDVSYFNGVKIGKTGGQFSHQFWNKPRTYKIPAAIVKKGKNQLAIRAYTWCYGGGFSGNPAGYRLEQKDHPEKILPLAGNWKLKQEFGFDGYPGGMSDELYQYWLRPVMPYSIRGILWYQGCSNGSENETYFQKTKQLVENWRQKWKRNLPYYLVQIANFSTISKKPAGGEGFAQVREAQLNVVKQLPNTGMAITIDLGETDDIHPKNKEDVAKRLLRWALVKEYGRKMEYSGSLYKSMKIESNKIRIIFDHADSGLMVGSKKGRVPVQEMNGSQLKQFAIAGADKKWVWANATIDGDTILVSSEKIKNPVAVRYAYRQNPVGCNLYNRAGLPASPFRTDHWINEK